MSVNDSDSRAGSTVVQETTPKQPVVRRGQRTPYRKAARAEIRTRIEVAALLCDLGYTKSQIHHIFRQRYFVQWRQTDRYLKAKDMTADTLKKSGLNSPTNSRFLTDQTHQL